MTSFRLHALGAQVLFERPDDLRLFTRAGQEVGRYARPPHRRPEGDDSVDFARAVVDFVVDARTQRFALLWNRGHVAFEGDDPECVTAPHGAEVEIVDASSGRRFSLKEPASQLGSLLAFSPSGDLYAQCEATGLAAFVASHPGAVLSEFAALFATDAFDGHLRSALGFHSLPHVDTLRFCADGQRAWSGSTSQYQSHLAYLGCVGPLEVLQRSQVETLAIHPRSQLTEALVHEGGARGGRTLALYRAAERPQGGAPLERVCEYAVATPGHVFDQVVCDVAVNRVVALSTDGSATIVDLGGGTRTVQVRTSRSPFGAAPEGGVAVSFACERMAVIDGGRGRLFSFEGALVAEREATRVFAEDDQLFLANGNELFSIGPSGEHLSLSRSRSSVVACVRVDGQLMVGDDEGAVTVVG